ncbi:MAG: exosortase T [Pseudomonadota bacterium]
MTKLPTQFATFALTLASIVLALDPLRWLVRTWQDPSYQSYGHWYVAALLGAVALSAASGPAARPRQTEGLLLIFLAAAMVRLLGQVLAVNILSALALAIDVFAIARLMRLDLRPRALSPVWLSAFFLFALPLAPILERVLGFPLQMASARVSCAMLRPFFADLDCASVRLKVNAVDVLVDLPCSGATGLLLMLTLWTGMNVWLRPGPLTAALGLVATLAAALLGNGLRITLLAGGLGLGLNTMDPVAHTTIGIVSLALSALPIMVLYRPAPRAAPVPRLSLPALPSYLLTPLACAAVLAAVWIVSLPKDPVDTSGRIAQRALPSQLLGHRRQAQTLSAVEQRYFEAYGGLAQKASYGALGLNIVQTGAPLRHLHDPSTCLLGMGYDVTFLGTRFDPLPSSIYRATSPDGQVWHVAVSYVSDDGHRTASVGEAVWTWLTGRSHRWTSVQRITPISLPPEARAAFEQAALAALDI